MKDLLKSLSSLNEAETKDTKTGRVHKGDYGTSYDGDDEKKPAASTEKRGRGRPKKGSDDSGEVKSYDTKSLSNVFGGGKAPKKAVGTVSKKHSLKEYIESAEQAMFEGDQVTIAPAQQNTQVIKQGDKTLGTVTNPQLANQIKQAMSQGQLNIAGMGQEDDMTEEVDTGEFDARKSTPQGKQNHDWDKNFREKLKQYSRELAQRQQEQQVAEAKAKPDFLDVDKDSDKEESFKKAVKDKEKVSEGRDHESSEYLDEKVAKILAREKPGMAAVSSNDEFYGAIYNELIQCGLTPKAARHKVSYDEDFIADVASAYAHYQKNPSLDEGSIEDHTQHGMDATPSKFVAVPAKQAPTPFKVDPIQATTDRAINFISGLRKPSNPFSESKTMKDMQVEGWANQLNSILSEGITVSSSQGQQGAPDSVTITATDGDSEQLLSVLRNAGIGVFGGNEKPEMGYGVVSQGEEEFDGTGTEPQPAPGVVGDGDDMLSMMKKMAGIEDGTDGADMGSSEGQGQDYEDEAGALEPTDGEEEGSDEDKEETDEGLVGAALGGAAGAALGKSPSAAMTGASIGSDIQDAFSGDEDEVEEGNAFTGKLKQTPKGGEFKMGDKSYKDTSAIEEEQEETCNECGCAMKEGHECESEQVEENFANSTQDPADTELAQLKALLSMGNDMHKMKHSQAMGNPVKVTMETRLMQDSTNLLSDFKKLSGI